MIDIFICEQNRFHLKGLLQMIGTMGEPFRLKGSAASIAEAFPYLQECEVDLLFLNTELADGSGFDLLNLLEEPGFKVVFTSESGDYALQAIRFAAMDYLVKPFSKEDLGKALARLPKDHSGQFGPDKQEAISRITIHGRKGIQFIDVNEVLFCKADINYTELHLRGERKIVSSKTLKEYDRMLTPHCFFRTHQSFLVNMRHVQHISRDKQPVVTLKNGEAVPLARGKRPLLIQRYGHVF